jgi:hypothetical protein
MRDTGHLHANDVNSDVRLSVSWPTPQMQVQAAKAVSGRAFVTDHVAPVVCPHHWQLALCAACHPITSPWPFSLPLPARRALRIAPQEPELACRALRPAKFVVPGAN